MADYICICVCFSFFSVAMIKYYDQRRRKNLFGLVSRGLESIIVGTHGSKQKTQQLGQMLRAHVLYRIQETEREVGNGVSF